jgi:2-hydroxychromene-2-carboxylate isomerase
MTDETVDFWFEFASTYSYPAAMRIAPLAKARGVNVRWRPFLLGPIFKAQGWDNSPFNLYPAKGRYMWRDLERICDALELPFAQPSPFPQNALAASRVALVALTQDWGEDYCRAVYRAEFGEGRNIGEPATVAAILTTLGKNAEQVMQQAQDNTIGRIARADRGDAAPRHFRRAQLRHCRRRIILGQRPPGSGARLGKGLS